MSEAGAVSIRRAERGDADLVSGLLAHDEVEPFLSARRPRGREAMLEQIDRSMREPGSFGVFVIEVDGDRVGMMEFETANERSRIAYLGGLAVDPAFRGRGLAEEAARALIHHLLLDLGFHRLQLEVYGFNDRAVRHAERVGFVREGVKRKAYRRHGGWHDGIMFGLVREDLGLPPAVDLLYEFTARHNQGVRTGDWEALGECLAGDARLEFGGVQLGPFCGREAIVAAYRARPPDDEVRLVDPVEEQGGDGVNAGYMWSRSPDEPGGTMRLEFVDGLISRLMVVVS
ncbi:MAG: GNAT family N-acetyltransferase [Verrucomicrobiota bacterium]